MAIVQYIPDRVWYATEYFLSVSLAGENSDERMRIQEWEARVTWLLRDVSQSKADFSFVDLSNIHGHCI